jgi:Flagellar hook-length control protein FliK.
MSLSNTALLLGLETTRPNKQPIKAASPHFKKPTPKAAAPIVEKPAHPFNKHLEKRDKHKSESPTVAAALALTGEATVLSESLTNERTIESVEFIYFNPALQDNGSTPNNNKVLTLPLDQHTHQMSLTALDEASVPELGLGLEAQGQQLFLNPHSQNQGQNQAQNQDDGMRFVVNFDAFTPAYDSSYDTLDFEQVDFSAPNWQAFQTENIQFQDTDASRTGLQPGTEPQRQFYATALQEKSIGPLEISRSLNPKYQHDFSALQQANEIQDEDALMSSSPAAIASVLANPIAGDQSPASPAMMPTALPLGKNSPIQNNADFNHDQQMQDQQMQEELSDHLDANLQLEELQELESHFTKALSASPAKPSSFESVTEALAPAKGFTPDNGDKGQMPLAPADAQPNGPALTMTRGASIPAQGLYTQHPSAMQQVAFSIKTGLAEGKDRLTVQLKPESLGKVEVKIEVAPDGRTSVVVATERAETYDLFRQDARHLMNQLEEAGLDVNNGDISYNMLDQHTPEQSEQRPSRLNSKEDASISEQTELNLASHPVHLVTPRHNGTWNEVA